VFPVATFLATASIPAFGVGTGTGTAGTFTALGIATGWNVAHFTARCPVPVGTHVIALDITASAFLNKFISVTHVIYMLLL